MCVNVVSKCVLQVNITSLLIHFPLAYFQFGRTSHTKIPHRGLLPHLPPNISALCVQRRSGMRTNWRNITEYTPGRNHTSVKNVIDGLTWKVTWGLISEVVNKTEDKLIGFFEGRLSLKIKAYSSVPHSHKELLKECHCGIYRQY